MNRRELFTVLLRHDCGEGSHYDWMVEDPNGEPGQAMLWTWRVNAPTRAWAAKVEMAMEQLSDHRRAYLTYEGAISGGRGEVRRVDEGRAVIESATDDRVVARVSMQEFAGVVTLTRVDGGRTWRATAEAAATE